MRNGVRVTVDTWMTALRARMRAHRVWRFAAVLPLMSGALLASGCHSKVTEGRAASYLIINQLAGAKSGSTEFGNVLQSDVLSNEGGIWEDNGRVTMTVALKDITSPTGPTTNNLITINRYRVQFRRTDGRNQQGVDVPYAFEGGITFTVTDAPTTATFVLVRVQAKLEAPLKALGSNGGAILIATLADVTFYGHDQTGTPVSAMGTISVNFANWADDED